MAIVMKRLSLHGLTLVLALTPGLFFVASTAEAQYGVPRYGYHPYHGYFRYGGYGGYGGGMTPGMGAGIGIGAAAQGLGQLQVDQGQYELEHTQAEAQYLQAYQEYLKTIELQRHTYDQRQQDFMKKYQAETAAARAQVAAYKKDMAARAAPHRLSSDQFDRQNSVITWPGILRDAQFDAGRYELDKLFAARTASNSGAGSENYAAIEKATDNMLKQVGEDINNLDVDEYITARHFISSLAYEARFTVNGVPAPVDR